MLRCPACATEIAPSTIRPARSVALCGGCDASIQLGGSPDAGWVVIGHQPPAPPEGLELLDTADPVGGYRDGASHSDWSARLPWRRRGAFYPGVMALAAPVAMTSFAVGPHRFFADRIPLPMHVAAYALWIGMTIGCGWWALAFLRNRTTVTVKQGLVSCHHGPIRVLLERSRPVELADVELFEVERRDPVYVLKNISGPTWEVVARLTGGQRRTVITRLPEERHARWLQKRLESGL